MKQSQITPMEELEDTISEIYRLIEHREEDLEDAVLLRERASLLREIWSLKDAVKFLEEQKRNPWQPAVGAAGESK